MDTGYPTECREQTPWGELVLRIRPGPEPSAALILEGTFLMDSESGASERALAVRGLTALRRRRGGFSGVQVLLGGLGLGITLRRLLDEPAVERVVAVELFAALIEWNHGCLAEINGGALADQRVVCHAGDLLELLADPAAGSQMARPFDLALFDIDNGPTFLSLPQNADLYTPQGTTRLRSWLAADGVAVFWATERAAAFEAVLEGLSWAAWHREEIAWHTARSGRHLFDTLYFLTPR